HSIALSKRARRRSPSTTVGRSPFWHSERRAPFALTCCEVGDRALLMPIRRALLSVSDKSGLIEFATLLHERGISLLSTGGTFQALRAAGIPVTAVEAYTESPEVMDGRVKTLHP